MVHHLIVVNRDEVDQCTHFLSRRRASKDITVRLLGHHLHRACRDEVTQRPFQAGREMCKAQAERDELRAQLAAIGDALAAA